MTPLQIVLIVAAGLVLVGFGLLAWRWPRASLIGLAITPIVDRYLISLALPEAMRTPTTYLSEGLLAIATIAILVQAARAGTLRRAVWHPVVWLLAGFIGLAGISAVANGVPPMVAMAGVVFTVEAAALYVLAGAAPFDDRHAVIAVAAFVAAAAFAALLAMGQVLVHPDFLGLESFAGRFGEGARVTSFLVSPNMLGAILAMALPFAVLAALGAEGWRRAAAWSIALLLSLALLYTFSRGSWFALALAVLLVGFAVERRLIVAMLLLAAVTFSIAFVLPRHLLYEQRDQERFDLIAATLGRLEALGEGEDLRVQFVENAMPIVADHPIIGAGPGRYGGAVARNFGSPLYETYTTGTVPSGRTVDNFWLHLLVEAGLLGVVAFATVIGLAVADALRAARTSASDRRAVATGIAALAVVLAIASLTEMLLEGNTTAFTMWLLLGVAAQKASR